MGSSSSSLVGETAQPSSSQFLGLWDARWHYGIHEESSQLSPEFYAADAIPFPPGPQGVEAPVHDSQQLLEQASLVPDSYSYPSLFMMDEETGDYVPTPHYQNMLSMAGSASPGACRAWKRIIAEQHGTHKSVQVTKVEDVEPTTPKYIGFNVRSDASACSSDHKPPRSESSMSCSTEHSHGATERSNGGSPSKRTSTLTQALQAAGRSPSPPHPPQPATAASGISAALSPRPHRPESSSSAASSSAWEPGYAGCGGDISSAGAGSGELSTAASSVADPQDPQEAERLKTPGDLTVRGAGLYAELMQRQKTMDIGVLPGRCSVRSGPLDVRAAYAQPAFRSEPLNAYVIADGSSTDSSPSISNLPSPSASPANSEPLHTTLTHHTHTGMRIPDPGAHRHHPHHTTHTHHAPLPHQSRHTSHQQQPTSHWSTPFQSHAAMAAAGAATIEASPFSQTRASTAGASWAYSHATSTSSALQWGGLHAALSARSQNQPIQPPRRSSMDGPRLSEGREVSFRQWQYPSRQASQQQETVEEAQSSGFTSGLMGAWLSGSNSDTSPNPMASCLASAAQQPSYGDLLQAGSVEGRLGLGMGHGSCSELEREHSLGQQAMWGAPHGSNNSTILA